ncbi:hypothetical protein LC593_36725 [Nostoc sp. CHAB 5844]|nr:hypothetical protein [Nostoc sp. CHAB 5844]
MMQGQWTRKAKNGLNIIFIHGINSSEECWKHDNGSYWPNLLRNESELADIGIYVFSYRTGINTGFYSLSDIVDSLREYFFRTYATGTKVLMRLRRKIDNRKL